MCPRPKCLTAMASKVDIPGSGQTVDLSNPTSAIKSFGMAALAFMLAAAAGSVGVRLYNAVAESTPDQIQKVDLI